MPRLFIHKFGSGNVASVRLRLPQVLDDRRDP